MENERQHDPLRSRAARREGGGVMAERIYRYRCKACRRPGLFGHLCRVIVRGGMNSALVEWLDGGRDVVSRNCLRMANGTAALATEDTEGGEAGNG